MNSKDVGPNVPLGRPVGGWKPEGMNPPSDSMKVRPKPRGGDVSRNVRHSMISRLSFSQSRTIPYWLPGAVG
jgi:hypothetical protein